MLGTAGRASAGALFFLGHGPAQHAQQDVAQFRRFDRFEQMGGDAQLLAQGKIPGTIARGQDDKVRFASSGMPRICSQSMKPSISGMWTSVSTSRKGVPAA